VSGQPNYANPMYSIDTPAVMTEMESLVREPAFLTSALSGRKQLYGKNGWSIPQSALTLVRSSHMHTSTCTAV